MPIWTGVPYPRGATWDGASVNFAIFSQRADSHAWSRRTF